MLIVVVCLHFLICFGSFQALVCYECRQGCFNPQNCSCQQTVQVANDSNLCLILRERVDDSFQIQIEHIPKAETDFNFDGPLFLYGTEKISYETETKLWKKSAQILALGCQQDRCNQADLLKRFPENGFSLTLPTFWLDENLLNSTNRFSTSCRVCVEDRICSDTRGDLNPDDCPISQCNGTCLTGEVYPLTDAAEYCIQSFCYDSSYFPSEITIQVVYYPDTKKLEVVGLNLFCNGLYCADQTLANWLKRELTFDNASIDRIFSINAANSISPSVVCALLFFQFLISRFFNV